MIQTLIDYHWQKIMLENTFMKMILKISKYFQLIKKKSKLEILREAKKKRPPTRYGNRKDQIPCQTSARSNNKEDCSFRSNIKLKIGNNLRINNFEGKNINNTFSNQRDWRCLTNLEEKVRL
jgi:hypothetical protein